MFIDKKAKIYSFVTGLRTKPGNDITMCLKIHIILLLPANLCFIQLIYSVRLIYCLNLKTINAVNNWRNNMKARVILPIILSMVLLT